MKMFNYSHLIIFVSCLIFCVCMGIVILLLFFKPTCKLEDIDVNSPKRMKQYRKLFNLK